MFTKFNWKSHLELFYSNFTVLLVLKSIKLPALVFNISVKEYYRIDI